MVTANMKEAIVLQNTWNVNIHETSMWNLPNAFLIIWL